MCFHHHLTPPSSLSNVLVELYGRRAGPQHPSARRVHVRQVVERQNMSGLKKEPNRLFYHINNYNVSKVLII